MNIFKGLMFLPGDRIRLEYVDDIDDAKRELSYAEGYGNRVASARMFGPDRHHGRHPSGQMPSPRTGCPAGGCA